jgi:hypothetical protein
MKLIFLKINENNFDIRISTHRPHHVFMEICGFGSNEIITILYKNYSCGAFKKHFIILYQFLNQPSIIYNV